MTVDRGEIEPVPEFFDAPWPWLKVAKYSPCSKDPFCPCRPKIRARALQIGMQTEREYIVVGSGE